jgi:hypothetical protein
MPAGWDEVDPGSFDLEVPALTPMGANGLIYWNRHDERVVHRIRCQHPADAFYRGLVARLMNEEGMALRRVKGALLAFPRARSRVYFLRLPIQLP